MTNRKLKGNKVQDNIRLRAFFDAGERNIAGAWLALLKMNVSRAKVLEIDDMLYNETVEQFREWCKDKVLDAKMESFMLNVNLTDDDLIPILHKRKKQIIQAYVAKEAILIALQNIATDFIMVLWLIHNELGYGEKRLKKVIQFISDYEGDEKADIKEKLNITYPDSSTLPDYSQMQQEMRQRKREQQWQNEKAAEMIAGIR